VTLLATVVETSQQVADTRSRRRKIELLAECLRELDPYEIEIVVAYLSGEMRQGRIGIGWASVRDAVPGEGAATPVLQILDVHRTLDRIKATSGAGSKHAKMKTLVELLARATGAEQRFLQRLLIGEVRHGALEGIMVEAIAAASDVPAADVRRAAMLGGDVGEVAVTAFAEGPAGLARFSIELFRPLQPMLAQPSEGVEDAITRIGRTAFEWKLDGARVQVHRDGDDVRVYSRRLNDVTAAVPEVVEMVRRLPVRRLVLDGEAIALRPDGTPHPFQVTMRRFGRRVDVERVRAEIPIAPWFFDCLHVDGEDILDRTTEERHAALAAALPDDLIVPRLVTEDAEAADAFLDDVLRRGHEGVLAKSLDASYEAGRRGGGWLKVKPTHTLDLVVLAAEWGSGRRRGWLSNLHLGARDPSTNTFVMLGKTFKGMTDETLAWQTKKLQEIELAREEHVVHVRPELVVEIAFDGVQTSPHYPGGLALRFARLKRYRADKAAVDADTIDTVREIHAKGHA
jgi:DNA ligase-1